MFAIHLDYYNYFVYNSIPSNTAVHGVMGCGQKSFKLVWQYHQLLSEFLPKGHLPRMSLQSYIPANDMGDNGMIPGAVHRSPGIYFTAEENSGKAQLGNHR